MKEVTKNISDISSDFMSLKVNIRPRRQWSQEDVSLCVKVFSLKARVNVETLCNEKFEYTSLDWAPSIFGALWNPVILSDGEGFSLIGARAHQQLIAKSSTDFPEEVLNYFVRSFGSDVKIFISGAANLPKSTQRLLVEDDNATVLRVLARNMVVDESIRLMAGLRGIL